MRYQSLCDSFNFILFIYIYITIKLQYRFLIIAIGHFSNTYMKWLGDIYIRISYMNIQYFSHFGSIFKFFVVILKICFYGLKNFNTFPGRHYISERMWHKIVHFCIISIIKRLKFAMYFLVCIIF